MQISYEIVSIAHVRQLTVPLNPTGSLFAGFAHSGSLSKNLVDRTRNFLLVSASGDRVLIRQQ